MYVTRPLSLYKSHPDLLSVPPVEGPGSGYLILQGLQDSNYVSNWFGREIKDYSFKDPPFPQDKLLVVEYRSGDDNFKDKAFFIPVIDQPLSSNCYYVMIPDSKHKGLAYTSAMEEDEQASCFCCTYIPDKKPKLLNPHDTSQQFKILKQSKGFFIARSVDPDGFPPLFLRRQGWQIRASKAKCITIDEAGGIDSTLRSELPNFDFPLSRERTQPVNVGKWYCPYMFIIEGSPKEQIERSMFYEMTLKQRWERIYECERGDVEGNTVSLSVVVPTELVKISYTYAVSERDETKGIMWFWIMSEFGLQTKIGLNLVIIERMIWEQERVGWAGGNEKQMMVARMEKYEGESWKKFGCYVLNEQFVLKRPDGSVVLTYEFKHTQLIRCKWE